MIGLERGKVKLITNPKECWEKEFELERNKLHFLLEPYVVDIQHIGSTSIKNIASKPIIDLAIGLKHWDDVNTVKNILKENGYHYRENAGDDNRIFFAKGNEDCRTHYLHIYEFGSLGWRDHTYFRDFLNTHDSYRKEYERIKTNLCSMYSEDRDAYTEGKGAFIKNVINSKNKQYMIRNMEEIKYYAKAYRIPEEDVTMIALNAMGVDSILTQPRLRMRIALENKEAKRFYMGVANHSESPFKMYEGQIFLGHYHVAHTFDVENNDCASRCKSHGFIANTLYVLGLDSLGDTIKGLDEYINASGCFPIVDVFQPHTTEHYNLLSDDAWSMGYYLSVRKFLESKYKGAGIIPQSWECYRPLWYFSFGEEKSL